MEAKKVLAKLKPWSSAMLDINLVAIRAHPRVALLIQGMAWLEILEDCKNYEFQSEPQSKPSDKRGRHGSGLTNISNISKALNELLSASELSGMLESGDDEVIARFLLGVEIGRLCSELKLDMSAAQEAEESAAQKNKRLNAGKIDAAKAKKREFWAEYIRLLKDGQTESVAEKKAGESLGINKKTANRYKNDLHKFLDVF